MLWMATILLCFVDGAKLSPVVLFFLQVYPTMLTDTLTASVKVCCENEVDGAI